MRPFWSKMKAYTSLVIVLLVIDPDALVDDDEARTDADLEPAVASSCAARRPT
jgi:hypothetical protein